MGIKQKDGYKNQHPVRRTELLKQMNISGEMFRKKPVIIRAFKTDKVIFIETLEGMHRANVGDFIIEGVKGEMYPCKPDIFEKTYEKVNKQ